MFSFFTQLERAPSFGAAETSKAQALLGLERCAYNYSAMATDAAVVARSLGCQCDTEMPTGRTLTETPLEDRVGIKEIKREKEVS